MPGIIIEGTKTVYWPIPKNGCTTMKAYLCQVFGLGNQKNVHTAPFPKTPTPMKGYRNFAIVRNPYARLYSLWKNKISPERVKHPKFKENQVDPNVFKRWPDLFRANMSFEEFVDAVLSIPPQEADHHFSPQSLQIPKQGVEICKLEEVAPLMHSIMPAYNTSPKSDWKSFYKFGSMTQRVWDYYKQDFLRFKYPLPFNTILVDCDGVLTDGKLTIDRNGEKSFKSFHARDVRAIRELVSHGYNIVLVTADGWPGIYHFAEKVRAEVCVKRNKAEIPYTNYLAIGDDAWDVPMMENASGRFAPLDADPSILQMPFVNRLETPGGKGVMAELARILLGEG